MLKEGEEEMIAIETGAQQRFFPPQGFGAKTEAGETVQLGLNKALAFFHGHMFAYCKQKGKESLRNGG